MDTKQLIDNFINGEITEEQFDEQTSKLSSDELENLTKDAEGKLPDAVEKLKGIRRGIQKLGSKSETAPVVQESDTAKKMREENLNDAFSQMFATLGVSTVEEQEKFKEGFKKYDSGAVNVNNIIKDIKSYVAASNPDEYFDLKAKQREAEEAAEEFTAQQAGSNGGGSGGANKDGKISKEVKAYMDASAKQGRVVTPEFAARAIEIARNKGRIS